MNRALTKIANDSPGVPHGCGDEPVEHPELTVEDYRRILDVVENAETIIQDGDQTLVFLRLARLKRRGTFW